MTAIDTNWKQLGREIASQIQNLTDESAIAAIAVETIQKINTERSTPQSRKSALDSLCKPIRESFPNSLNKPKSPVYRHTGKSTKRWRHVIFDYLTLSSDDYNQIDPQRQEWFQQQLPQQTEPDNCAAPKQTLQTTINVNNIIDISQLELEIKTQHMIEQAIALHNISLPDFIKRACQVYAKTIVNKALTVDVDLASIPTAHLLQEKKYQTLPGRAQELTKRAVRAIKKHNANAPEPDQRWHITQNAIVNLTGSRPADVAKALAQFTDDIKYMETTYGLNNYSNRKGKDLEGNTREIQHEIDLVALVPDGYTL